MGYCHLLADGPRSVMIDTGLAGEAFFIRRLFRRLGLAPADLHAILLTHGHLDHAGNLAYMSMQSLFPALLAIITVLTMIGQGPAAVQWMMELLETVAPAPIVDLMREPLHNLVHLRDLELVLAVSRRDGARPGDDASALRVILENTVEHLGCALVALLVPEKSLVLFRMSQEQPADGRLLAQTHRHLLSLGQVRRDLLELPRPVLADVHAPVAGAKDNGASIAGRSHDDIGRVPQDHRPAVVGEADGRRLP